MRIPGHLFFEKPPFGDSCFSVSRVFTPSVVHLLVNHHQLMEFADCKQQARLIEWLMENGIKFTLNRKGKPVTTTEQINNALEASGQEVIEFGQE